LFRYALERWRHTQDEDRYQVVLFHRGPLTAVEDKTLAVLRAAAAGDVSLVNLSVEAVDLAGEVETSWQELWGQQKDATLPWLVVRAPVSTADRATVWSGPFQADTVDALLDSPARRELAQRLLRGDAIVWLLLESGDKEQDDRVAELLQTESRRLEKSVLLPDVGASDPIGLLSSLPLQTVFSTLRIRRSDPAEAMLLAMLLNSDSKLARASGPLVFSIFGRGRVLEALADAQITAAALEEDVNFLCSACSCQVKRLNPGFDLLITADWDAILEDRAPVAWTAPTRTGERVPIPSPKQTGENSEVVASTPEPDATTAQPVSPIMLALVAVVALVTIGTGILAWRSQGRRRKEGGT
jgi:hypothetical protein